MKIVPKSTLAVYGRRYKPKAQPNYFHFAPDRERWLVEHDWVDPFEPALGVTGKPYVRTGDRAWKVARDARRAKSRSAQA